MLESIKNTLRDLEVPDPAIHLVADYYGVVDNSDFLLKEVQWAEEELRSSSKNFEEVGSAALCPRGREMVGGCLRVPQRR